MCITITYIVYYIYCIQYCQCQCHKSKNVVTVGYINRQVESLVNLIKVNSTELSKIQIGIKFDDFKNLELPGCH